MTTVSQLKHSLSAAPSSAVRFLLPDGSVLPEHFHITEVGHVTKDFVDCGGTRHTTASCVLQTLVAHDVDHRLGAEKFSKILELTSKVLPDESLPIEIEYDSGTTGIFPIESITVTENGIDLVLENKHTACLAPDKCGLTPPEEAPPACEPASNC